MKKITGLFLGALSAIGLAFLPMSVSASADGDEKQDITFGRENYYVLEEAFEEMPKTFEAWVQLDPSRVTVGGTIFGNIDANVHVSRPNSYTNLSTNAISVEIDTKGHPKLYHKDDKGEVVSAIFYGVDVRANDFVHLAITRDENKAYCYLNGKLQDEAEFVIDDFVSAYSFAVGSDFRETRNNYFKGKIKSLAVYSDERTATEILADKTAVDVNDEDLMVSYDLSGKSGEDVIEDLSQSDNDLTREWLFADDIEQDDYDYSMMVLGDTQALNYYRQSQQGLTSYDDLFDYIVENAEEQKVQHIFHLGDITQMAGGSTVAPNEYEYTKTNYEKLDTLYEETGISYSVLAGNHDFGSNRTSAKYSAIFGGTESAYANQYFSSSDPERGLNTAHKFTVGNVNYLVVSISFYATETDIAWAEDLIASHPYHNVIIATHAYRNQKGNLSPLSSYIEDDEYNWVQAIDELSNRHENVVLTLNGHHPTSAIETFVNYRENGSKITNMVVDPTYFDGEHAANTAPNFSNGAGLIAYLRFSDGGRKVGVSWYSAIVGKYYNSDSVYTVEIPVIEARKVNVEVQGGGEATASNAALLTDPVTVTFTPKANYHLSKVTLNGADITADVSDNTYTVSQSEGRFNLLAEFAEDDKYTVAVENAAEKGTVIMTSTKTHYFKGEEVSFKVAPKSGYKVSNVTYNGTVIEQNANGEYTVTVTGENDGLSVAYTEVTVEPVINTPDDGSPQGNKNIGTTIAISVAVGFVVALGAGIAFVFGTKKRGGEEE